MQIKQLWELGPENLRAGGDIREQYGTVHCLSSFKPHYTSSHAVSMYAM